jgi:hypothetical protein
MCVMNFLLKPVPYKTSHGSHTRNADLTKVILTPVQPWSPFIIYIYINKVCDVCDTTQSPSRRGSTAHRFTPLYVRNTCSRAKSLIRLQEVMRLIISPAFLRGLLRCKSLSKIRHATSIV